MKKAMQYVTFLAILIMAPMYGNAQYILEFEDFLADSLVWGGGIHGLAVDGEGKVWVHAWAHLDEFQGEETRPIYVYKDPYGKEMADFSPIHQLTYDGEDYLVAGGGISRGLATDHNGDILASLGTVLYRIDHQTGEVLNRRDFEVAALSAAASTENGEVVVAFASAELPIVLMEENFDDIQFATPMAPGSRTIQISDDGRYIYAFHFDAQQFFIYHSEEGVEGNYVPQLALEGVYIESSEIHPQTGHLWFCGNPPRVTQQNFNFNPVTWYAIDIEAVKDGTPVEQAVVTSVPWAFWDGSEDVRPRGVAFSPDGSKAYFAMYRASVIHVYTDATQYITGVKEDSEIAGKIRLSQNYPNPFNPSTLINFTLENDNHTTLTVYNLLGEKVDILVDENLHSGTHSVDFNAKNLSTGIYIYTLRAGEAYISRKMIYIK